MTDLLKKFNVLLRARLREAASDAIHPRREGSTRLGADIDREIAKLRGRLDEAFRYEETLKAQIDALQTEASQNDLAADSALEAGQTDAARQAIEAMQRAQRRMAMIESDLAVHQRAARELLERINLFDAAVADARRETTSTNQAPSPEPTSLTTSLSDVLQETRETISRLGETEQAKDTPALVTNAQSIDDDLERRIERLSRRE